MSSEQKLPPWYGHLADGLSIGQPTPRAKLTIVSAKPKRKRKPLLVRALREAKDAGVAVAGATVEADKVTLQFGEAQTEPKNDLDKWLAKHNAN
jgi:hypothetical protein